MPIRTRLAGLLFVIVAVSACIPPAVPASPTPAGQSPAAVGHRPPDGRPVRRRRHRPGAVSRTTGERPGRIASPRPRRGVRSRRDHDGGPCGLRDRDIARRDGSEPGELPSRDEPPEPAPVAPCGGQGRRSPRPWPPRRRIALRCARARSRSLPSSPTCWPSPRRRPAWPPPWVSTSPWRRCRSTRRSRSARCRRSPRRHRRRPPSRLPRARSPPSPRRISVPAPRSRPTA